jgi:pilus assembly protein CpaE
MDTHISEAQASASTVDKTIVLKGYLQDQGSREALSGAAKFLEFTVSVHTGNIEAAIRALDGTRSPNVLVVDISGVNLELSAMEALAHVCEPNVQVIAVGDRNDIGLYRCLKSLGVAEYLYKPVTQERFEQALREVAGRVPSRSKARLGKLISVVGASGGVGTTTLTVNLAAHMARTARRRVALIDLDLAAGTTSLLLNTVPNGSLCEALDNPERVDTKFLERAMLRIDERLDVLCSDGEKMPVRGLTAAAVRNVMEHVQSLYHYTVVDVPAAVASADPAILADSDIVFVVCDGALTGVRAAARLSRSLSACCPTVRIVLNRSGAPGQVSMTELERILGRRPDLVVPFLPRQFADAAILGTPAEASSRRVASAIGCLTREAAGHPTTRISFFDRIFRR